MTRHLFKKQFFSRRQRSAVVCVLCLFLFCAHGCGNTPKEAAAPMDAGQAGAGLQDTATDMGQAGAGLQDTASGIPDAENRTDILNASGAAASGISEYTDDTALPDANSRSSDAEADTAASDSTDAPAADDTTVTFMVYMDAASLESGDAPFATYDLMQMMDADLSDRVRVIVQTGGTRSWGQTDSISDERNAAALSAEADAQPFLTDTSQISSVSTQRYEVLDGGMLLLEDTGIQQNMTDAQTLKEFLLFCVEEAPADRYMLLLWGHGRGPEIGYGQDDFQGFHSAMPLTALADAVRTASAEGGFTIELIGFDACLMGCVETIHALNGCCDYLAVSEDYEPAYGWQYTRVLNALSENPSIPMTQLAQIIVDAYIEEAERSGDRGILAVLDMYYADALWAAWQDFYDTNVADMDALIYQVWHDSSLLSPVPANPNGYISDDDQYSLQDYGLTDLAALCGLVPSAEADAVLDLLAQALTAADSFHMARTMCGIAVCPSSRP